MITRLQSRLGQGSTLRRRVARSTGWALAGSVIGQGSGLIVSIVLARMLGDNGFGQYGMVVNTVSMIGVFAGMGLGLTATKYIAELRVSSPTRAGTLLRLTNTLVVLSGGVLAIGLFIGAPWIAANLVNAPELAQQLRLASLLVFMNAVNSVQLAALAGFERFDISARINLLRGMVNIPLAATLTYFYGLNGAVAAMIIVTSFAAVISQIELRRQTKKEGILGSWSWSDLRHEFPVLWHFSVPALLAGLMVGPVTWAGNTILVNQPNGYAQLGVFNAANQWRIALLFLPAVIGQSTLPVLSSLLGEQDRQRSRKLMLTSMALSVAVVLPLAILLVLLRDTIMGLYGPEFADYAGVLAIVAASTVVLAAQTPVGNAIAALGKMWIGTAMNAGWAVVFLLTAYLLMSNGWGAYGLACAYLVAYSVHGIWTFAYSLVALRC